MLSEKSIIDKGFDENYGASRTESNIYLISWQIFSLTTNERISQI